MGNRKLPMGMETPPSINSSFQEKMIVETRKYELITPLFGGGVEPNTPDPVTVIRASEIRGHLRFWWRATRGGQFTTIKQLKAKEDEIWGAAAKFDKEGKSSGASEVSIEVEITNLDEIKHIQSYKIQKKDNQYVAKYIAASTAPEYLCFPLKPTKELIEEKGFQTPIPCLVENVKFNLHVTLREDFLDEINATLWAWENFGGIGARTRRGFGALKRLCMDSELPPSIPSEFSAWFLEKAKTHIKYGIGVDNVPILSNEPIFGVTPAKNKTIDIWRELSDKLKFFRSIKDETPFYKREVETIRKLFENNNYKTNVNDFQRAYLGLPIAYQNLKRVYHLGKKIEKATLRGRKQQRLTSPVILRPVACRDGRSIGIALKLMNTKLPEELTIDDYDFSIQTQVQNNPNVISAFIQFVRSKNDE